MRTNRIIKLVIVSALVLGAVPFAWSRVQTQSRMWIPNKTPAHVTFIGGKACAECHGDKVKTHAQTLMGRALEPVAQSEILSKNTKLTFRTGPYLYEIVRQGEQSIYTITNGKETISLPVLYAFGQGFAGQTYVLKGQNEIYESRVSFYNDTQSLDYTIGVPPTVPLSLQDAIGRVMSKDETLQCFGCHTTGTVKGGKIDYQNLVAGIGCEACHGPGGEHVELGKKGEPNAHKIFNPGKLSGDDLSQEYCAACHRSVEDVTALPRLGGMNNVRFQPYRIFNSKCYSDDRRISCIACHDVHQPMKQEAAAYDAKCAACHSDKAIEPAATRKCKVESKNCTECHMPKIELPGAHFKFTDHRIRIVKPGEPFPF